MAFKEARKNTKKGKTQIYKSVKPVHETGKGTKGKYELPRNGPQKPGNRGSNK